jgi:acyl-[acyl-carrier-protein]-phospholipid O-acyltransferase / long-chain-fatty-acid--[acyl-carrier-protein] ligase
MAGGSYGQTLRRRGVQPFLWTQFLGAFNDNVCKIVVTFLTIQLFQSAPPSWLEVRDPTSAGAAIVGAIFVLPFLLFSGYAGHVADVCSKRRVLIWMKWVEVVAMAAMVPALMLAARGSIWPVLAVLFVMAIQATFFSPAKYGVVPEALPAEDLSRANGLLEMSTFVAIVLGTILGGELFQAWHGAPWLTGGLLTAIAAAGTATSYGIPATAPAKPPSRLALNPFNEVVHGTRRLLLDRNLLMTVVGISFFWFVGALIQLAVLPYGLHELNVGEAASTRLFTALAIGIGVGSLVAGRLSGDKIELGLVPIGAFGMGVFSLALVWTPPSYFLSAAALLMIGFFGGWFAVPLNALLQQKPASSEKGRILATNNVANTIGILFASAALYWLGDRMHLSASQILGIAGLVTLLSTIYLLAILPDFAVRFVLWMLAHTAYRIKIVGRPNIPLNGPALIIANHISMIDGALVGACVQRFVRFMVYGPHFRKPGIHWLLKRLHAIPVTSGSRAEVMAAIDRARAELAAGHVVCIFVEGAVSRTGNLLPFKRGFERIVAGLDVPIIPVYLDRVWGSVFSFKRGKFFWKVPERLPRPVTVAFGAPLPSTTTAPIARLAIMELGAEAMKHRRQSSHLLHTEFIRAARRRWSELAMADSTGQKLTFGRALVGSRLLAREIARRTHGQEHVGLLLPASVGGALANIATLMAGRVPVNLNFTIGVEAMGEAIAQAGISTIITSKRFIAKAGVEELPAMLFLEDLLAEISSFSKAATLVTSRLVPAWMLKRWHRHGRTSDAAATIIFSSGSTGVPKGIVLSHANVLANVDSLDQIFPMEPSDCFIGVLPFFHSFGFTGTMWFPLLQGSSVVYHPNPMDAKTIGELAGEYGATMLISTPTFCNSYLRRCTPDQFASLKYAIVGAEKLREPLASAWAKQFGIPLLEGYGCTEMAPVVAVNRPDVALGHQRQTGTKVGSVGHPIPGVAAKIVDQETGEGPIYDRPGLLLVKGPNLMTGYLAQPEKTAEVLRDGWYVTGDVAMMDEEGFIFITDRLSRFSKIGGEMVPHLRIEEAINGVLGDVCSAITAVPDAVRGERLVGFYTRADISSGDLWDKLCETDLPRLWLPKCEHLIQISEIPALGTGKVDLRRLKQMAVEHAGETTIVRSR